MRVFCKNCNCWINFKEETCGDIYFDFNDLMRLKKNEYTYLCTCGMAITFYVYDEILKKVKKVESCYKIKEELFIISSLYDDNLTIDKKKLLSLYDDTCKTWKLFKILEVYKTSTAYNSRKYYHNITFFIENINDNEKIEINPMLNFIKQD